MKFGRSQGSWAGLSFLTAVIFCGEDVAELLELLELLENFSVLSHTGRVG